METVLFHATLRGEKVRVRLCQSCDNLTGEILQYAVPRRKRYHSPWSGPHGDDHVADTRCDGCDFGHHAESLEAIQPWWIVLRLIVAEATEQHEQDVQVMVIT